MARTIMKDAYSPPYLWRLFFTGLSFLFFGLGGLLLTLVGFPLVNLLFRDPLRKRHAVRCLINGIFRFFVEFMRFTGVLTYSVTNMERLGRPGQMVIANHPSLIDVVVLIAFIRDANCVVKESLWHNPFMRATLRAAGYISNNASMEMFDDTVAALKEGQTLIIFPEGTRTIPGEMPKFHRGATAIALRGAQVITPVVIRVQPTTLTKAEPWYNIPPRRPNFSFTVGEDINPQDFAVNNLAPTASRKLDAYLHSYYAQELTKNE